MRQGEGCCQTGPSGALRRLGDRVGSAALPAFHFAFLLSPRPLQSWHEVLGFLWALLKG